MSPEEVFEFLNTHVVPIGVKLLGGLLFWIIGGWIINLTTRVVDKALSVRKIDDTLRNYAKSTIEVLLKIALVVGILGWFGVETTTFAALIAAAGVAIGMAWSGLLANLAAGVFLIVLRPFKVGDFVTVGGVTGTVREISLFVTKLDSLDNVEHIVGNNKVFSENIQNFSANPYRRVDLVAQLNHSVDYNDAIACNDGVIGLQSDFARFCVYSRRKLYFLEFMPRRLADDIDFHFAKLFRRPAFVEHRLHSRFRRQSYRSFLCFAAIADLDSANAMGARRRRIAIRPDRESGQPTESGASNRRNKQA